MTDESLRSIELTKIGDARFKATNVRGGETFMGTGGEDPDFTPIELLLAAIAGCSANAAASRVPSISVSVTRYLSHQFSNAATMCLRWRAMRRSACRSSASR